MARLRRSFIPGVSAHIIKRGNNRAAVFSRSADFEQFLECVQAASSSHRVAVHAYVLMTNHVHLLTTPDGAGSVPGFMKQVGERYSSYFNAAYNRSGTPWAGRYKAHLVRDERYWLTCLRYIELNPVRARMVVRAEDYHWSSYAAHASGHGANGWLHQHPLFDALGRSPAERAAVYRRLCSAELTEEEVRILRAPARKWCKWGQTPGSDPKT